MIKTNSCEKTIKDFSQQVNQINKVNIEVNCKKDLAEHFNKI